LVTVVIDTIAQLCGSGKYRTVSIIAIHQRTTISLIEETVSICVFASSVRGADTGNDYETAIALVKRITLQRYIEASGSICIEGIRNTEQLLRAHANKSGSSQWIQPNLQEIQP